MLAYSVVCQVAVHAHATELTVAMFRHVQQGLQDTPLLICTVTCSCQTYNCSTTAHLHSKSHWTVLNCRTVDRPATILLVPCLCSKHCTASVASLQQLQPKHALQAFVSCQCKSLTNKEALDHKLTLHTAQKSQLVCCNACQLSQQSQLICCNARALQQQGQLIC